MKLIGVVIESDFTEKAERFAYIDGEIFNIAPRPINKHMIVSMKILLNEDEIRKIVSEGEKVCENEEPNTKE